MDMLHVLGLRQECSNYVQPLFNEINNCIDQYESFYGKLTDEFPYFNWGEYGHRIICHWGFDLDKDLSERNFQDSLARLFNAKIFAGYSKTHDGAVLTDDIWYKEWNKFLIFLSEHQKKQNEILTNKAKQVLGLNFSVSEDVAAVLYYTHLLGDHIEHSGAKTGESVLDLSKIERNLSLHIQSLSKKCDKFYSDYERDVKRINTLNDRDRAQAILNCLIRTIPSILQYKYAGEFAAKNLIFDDEIDMQDAA